MNPKTRTLFLFIVGAFFGMLAMYLYNNYKIEKKSPTTEIIRENGNDSGNPSLEHSKTTKSAVGTSIDQLTDEQVVIGYVKSNKKLPDYYLTKNEARKQGWVASKGNLCDVLPGSAIGGDHFSNREKQLPKGAAYFEADVNYSCGRRNADRIIFTKSGDVWLTKNHYKTFEKQ